LTVVETQPEMKSLRSSKRGTGFASIRRRVSTWSEPSEAVSLKCTSCTAWPSRSPL
jgi:hypothetical protein